jgi:hypothetical protein
MNRHDPTAPAPAVFPADLEKGVANLQNRGFIPSAADVTPAFTHEPAPVTAGNAAMYPHHEQYVKGEIYSSPFGFNASNLKLDLVTPMYKPTAATGDSRAQPTADASSTAYGWQAMEQMERDDQQQESGAAFSSAGGTSAGNAGSSEYMGATDGREGAGFSSGDASQGGDSLAGADSGQRGYTLTTVGMNLSEDDYSGLENATLSADTSGASGAQGVSTAGNGQNRGGYKVDITHLMIRNGQLMKTPELNAFLHKHKGRAGVLKDLLTMLEECLQHYALPLGVVDGLALLRLADKGDGDLCAPTELDLLYCLVNVEQVLGMVNIPGQAYRGNEGGGSAATMIQATWRGVQARSDHRLLMAADIAARRIASCWRVWWQRRKMSARLCEMEVERQVKFDQRQDDFCSRWHTIRSRARVEVHIASLSRPSHQRRTLSNLAARENSQMARLCRLSDPLVDVVYVCPFPLSDDVAQYYHKLLGVGGVSEAGSRYRIVYPENYDRMPFGLSLTSLLLYSPRCLKRIRNFCRYAAMPLARRVCLAKATQRAICARSEFLAVAGVKTPTWYRALLVQKTSDWRSY